MNIVKQNQMKLKISKLSSQNVSFLFILKIQKNFSTSKKNFHNSTVNNTNNNSISSIKATKNIYISAKNNLFNKKIPSFKHKASLKHYNFGDKIYIYQKKNESQQHINAKSGHFPIDLLSKSKAQYNKNNIMKSSNYIKSCGNNVNNNNNCNKKNVNISINNKSTQLKNNNGLYINNSHIIKNNSKICNVKKSNPNFTYINKNTSYNYSNKNNKDRAANNPTTTYIINTLTVSEKDLLSSGVGSSKQPKSTKKINKDYENEINKLIKEKEDCENTIKKQQRLIQKFEEDNEKLENKIKSIEHENKKINQKIELHQENQEQLIMLVKIVQRSGVNVEELIDKWNNEVEMENNSTVTNNSNNNNESYTDSINESNSKIDPSSFIPINIEEPKVNKKVFAGIPRLNFDIIKNNTENHKRGKFRNNSK